MATGETGDLVSTEWLAKHLNAPDVRILDASWYLPAEGRDPKAEYLDEHIPGARFFDIDEISDSASDLPHMAPPVEKFVSRIRAMGIGDGHKVIVYDSAGLFSAARVWWLFRLMGKTDVAVLDGGLPKWKAEGHPVEDDEPVMRDRHFTARRDASRVRDVTQVAAQVKLGQEQIVDARSPARFRGEEAEARAGLRSGHIPGSMNVHYATLLNEDGTLKEADALRAAFEGAGVDLDRPVITTCGSGITAAVLALGLSVLGHRQVALYDGSWTEWGMYPDLKVATG
ncbi:3-mercaptopyruvate sulfurtransferase [Roseobacter sp. HKCCA0434]|uniref:3-mercaptopyruvate sulfurtransferase n=1 Tax=Roseobacter sp. HKCCA0434 TaxID=3079297 RepID=UPI002905E15A|nr:3-mercaptopyruvate sulfurtransferase [Roseobacter sp. HKCCA0434]